MKTEKITLEALIQLEQQTTVLPNTMFANENDYETYRNHLPIYQILDNLYQNFLTTLEKEINKTNFKDNLSIIILITILLEKGYFIYTSTFHKINSPKLYFDLENENFFNGIYNQGWYVLAGYGCCRHFNSFICDLLTKMGKKCDKVCCLSCTGEEYDQLNSNTKHSINHLMIGYFQNGYYHLADSYNNTFCLLQLEDNFYLDFKNHNLITTDFEENLFQKKIHWLSSVPYHNNSLQEVMKKRKQVLLYLEKKGYKKFQKLKEKNFETIQKIAYFTPIELGRTQEKENQKRNYLKK